ncbi:transposase [Fructobacillus fructosus]|uniref:IS110 family transposase n=1 Tax=Fructobacillus fructosus TaxID=1631 RepID=UPI00021941DB|nr:IS110 family transposase [Fructobacillus fructosus]KRN53181.1 transposase [Fructobacillus fructosus KCTC 3544]GAP00958.1 transposase [Fructobacillus fructosus]
MHHVIGIDVSKSTSQVAVAVDQEIVETYKIEHNVFGFNRLKTSIQQFNEFPDIVFEATGIYSRRLKHFLDSHHYSYRFLNPSAAKKELDQLRPNKNDPNDAKNLALTQFILDRPKSYVQNPIYIELQDMSLFYQQLTHDIVTIKNRLHRVLQLTFPEIEELFSTTDSQQFLEILQAFPHASYAQHELQSLEDTIQSCCSRHIRQIRLERITKRLVSLASQAAPAVTMHSHTVYQVRYYSSQLVALMQEKDAVLNEMINQSRGLPEFEIYMSIPGLSDKTVVSLIAELGDITRFQTSNKLNAFIGIDLRFNDSGQYHSSGFITKRGNHIARKVLFKAIGNKASTATYGHPNHINDWYQKKKQSSDGRGTKKIAIGAMSRLIRTLHYLVLHNQLYDYEIASRNSTI